MPYNHTDWKDHVVQYPKTYTMQQNLDGTVTLFPAPGEIVQQGTPMSATNFNNLEAGIGDASAALDLLIQYVMMKIGRSDYTLDTMDAAKLDLHATADAAQKLTTARKIGITGGATGAGINFDGSGDINITVTALNPSELSSPVAVAKGGTGASDAAGARQNLGVVAQTNYDHYKTDRAKELCVLVVAIDAAESIHQAMERALDERITIAEAQLAALNT